MYFHSMRYLDIYAAMDCLEWARNKSFSFIGLKGWLSLFLWLEMLCLAILGDETFLVGLVFVVLISFVFMLLANIRIYCLINTPTQMVALRQVRLRTSI